MNLEIYISICLFSQSAEEDVLEELVDELSLGLCIEVHRSCKIGMFKLEEEDEEALKVNLDEYIALRYISYKLCQSLNLFLFTSLTADKVEMKSTYCSVVMLPTA